MKKILVVLAVILVFIAIVTFALTRQVENKTSSKTAQVTSTPPTPTPRSNAPRVFIMYVKNWSFAPNIIRVNKNDRVELRVKSVDVAHAFTIAGYNVGGKLEPFKFYTYTFLADKTGQFAITCTLNCGPAGYTDMKGLLYVD